MSRATPSKQASIAPGHALRETRAVALLFHQTSRTDSQFND
jgi:hypothetical protein